MMIGEQQRHYQQRRVLVRNTVILLILLIINYTGSYEIILALRLANSNVNSNNNNNMNLASSATQQTGTRKTTTTTQPMMNTNDENDNPTITTTVDLPTPTTMAAADDVVLEVPSQQQQQHNYVRHGGGSSASSQTSPQEGGVVDDVDVVPSSSLQQQQEQESPSTINTAVQEEESNSSTSIETMTKGVTTTTTVIKDEQQQPTTTDVVVNEVPQQHNSDSSKDEIKEQQQRDDSQEEDTKQQHDEDNNRDRPVTVDIISVGSILKPELQDAQESTFGSHALVRNFFKITELNDTSDPNCHINFTQDQLDNVMEFCRIHPGPSNVSQYFRSHMPLFFDHHWHPGWVCAQHRPIDAIYAILQRYKSGQEEIPSYLMIIDNDTYMNPNLDIIIHAVVNTTQTPTTTTPTRKTSATTTTGATTVHSQPRAPQDIPMAVAGCLMPGFNSVPLLFPVGGFGSIWTRGTIQNLLRPIHCHDHDHDDPLSKPNDNDNNEHDPFVRLACARLEQNLFGERTFFHNGMSMSDLLYEFSAQQPFTSIDTWDINAGFCFHSDLWMAYIIQYYHIVATPEQLADAATANAEPEPFMDTGYTRTWHSLPFDCAVEWQSCDPETNLFCHYINATQMYDYYNQHQQQQEQEQTSSTTI